MKMETIDPIKTIFLISVETGNEYSVMCQFRLKPKLLIEILIFIRDRNQILVEFY